MATIKLGSLLVRTLAKPLANSIKQQARNHPAFKDFCMGVAQKTHAWEHNLKTRFLGYPQENVRPLNDARAVETGANFISESVIFSVAVATIMGEAYRSSRKTSQRRQDVDADIDQLQAELSATENMMAEMKASINQLQSQVEALNSENRRLGREMERVASALKIKLVKEAFIRICTDGDCSSDRPELNQK
ncbi:optic atrophy 3 protein-domain-containing protein [Powellomyces hirtus]|nr:optic atrophy 3 protein-domain-containing protein [Powellomyces hirtus]